MPSVQIKSTQTAAIDFAGLLAMSLHILTDQLRAQLAAAGFDDIKRPYGFIFRAVARDGASINELADLLEVSKQATSKIIDEMASRDYVSRQEDPNDRRSKIVRLTERGHQAMQIALKVNAELESVLEARVGFETVKAMRLALDTFAREGNPDLYAQRGARPFW
jgi:DNA-binding MarR family transcriptional regulator